VPYDSLITRSDAAALVPEQVSQEMLGNLENTSAVLSLGNRIPIARSQVRFPVLSALPTAYFVNGDTGQKQTTEAAWDNKYLNVEEIAAIVPIPEAVLDDAGFDVFGSIRPLLEQAIGRSLDAAVLFGTNAPASWDDDIVTAALAAGNGVTRGTNNAAAGGVFGDLSDLVGKLEADGYMPSGTIANTTLRGRIRQTRATDGQKLDGDQITPDSLYGSPIQYPMRGQWPTGLSAAELVTGDWDNLVVGVRQDFTYKVLTESVIQNAEGDIVFNLSQQDMIALRIVFRVGVAVANPINYDQPTEGSRYPFAVLRSPAS
jgi:HK97 family phage major capsid protein